MIKRALLAASFVLVASTPLTSLAQDKPKAANEVEAIQHFDKGNELYKQSKFREAEAEFQKAWDLKQTFDIAANLGDCEVEIQQFREAAEHLAYAVREFPVSGKATTKERLQARFNTVRPKVGALKITSAQPGVQVTVDDLAVGSTPLGRDIFVDPGSHKVVGHSTDYQDITQQITIEAGKDLPVTLTLEKIPGTVGPEEIQRPTPVLIGGLAVAVAAGAAGIIFTVLASGKQSDAVNATAEITAQRGPHGCQGAFKTSTDCQTVVDSLSSHDTFQTVSLAAFIGAGAIAAGTVIYYFAAGTPKKTTTGAVRVLPMVGSTNGLVATGTW